jgi:hypothetical protein
MNDQQLERPVVVGYKLKLIEWKWKCVLLDQLGFVKFWRRHSAATLALRPSGPETSTPTSSPWYFTAAALKISANSIRPHNFSFHHDHLYHGHHEYL